MDTYFQEPLGKAIALYPTLRAFSDSLGVRYQVVQQWLVNGVPAEYCPRIERLTKGEIRCEQLNNRVDWDYLRAASTTESTTRDRRKPKTPAHCKNDN